MRDANGKRRAAIYVRVAEEVKRRLEEAARDARRSLTGEVQLAIEAHLDRRSNGKRRRA